MGLGSLPAASPFQLPTGSNTQLPSAHSLWFHLQRVTRSQAIPGAAGAAWGSLSSWGSQGQLGQLGQLGSLGQPEQPGYLASISPTPPSENSHQGRHSEGGPGLLQEPAGGQEDRPASVGTWTLAAGACPSEVPASREEGAGAGSREAVAGHPPHRCCSQVTLSEPRKDTHHPEVTGSVLGLRTPWWVGTDQQAICLALEKTGSLVPQSSGESLTHGPLPTLGGEEQLSAGAGANPRPWALRQQCHMGGAVWTTGSS